jgi:hypothetical protein
MQHRLDLALVEVHQHFVCNSSITLSQTMEVRSVSAAASSCLLNKRLSLTPTSPDACSSSLVATLAA